MKVAIALPAAAFLVCATSMAQEAAPKPAALPALKSLQALVNSATLSAKTATDDPIGYGWPLFFYTAWPGFTDPARRGQPDPSKKLGQQGPAVWEMWKNSDRCFLLMVTNRRRGIPRSRFPETSPSDPSSRPIPETTGRI